MDTPDEVADKMLTSVQAVGWVDIGTGDRGNYVRRAFNIGDEQYELHLKKVER